MKLHVVPTLALTLAIAAATSACPDRREAIEQVGGAPKEQVDVARQRLDKAEAKLEQNAAAAAAATE